MSNIAKCWLYEEIDKADKVNCINCLYWNKEKHWCNGEYLLTKQYRETDEILRG